jgi:membrane-associated phospholipid phosphatase
MRRCGLVNRLAFCFGGNDAQIMSSLAIFLRNFRAKAETVERQSPLDPLSWFIYASLMIAALIEGVLLLATDFYVGSMILIQLFSFVVGLTVAGLFARSYGMPRIAIALEAFALPTLIGILCGTALIMVTPFSFPLADPALAYADRLLGFDWIRFYRFNMARPWLVSASSHAYDTLYWQGAVMPLFMAIFGNRRHVWRFLAGWLLVMVFAVVIYPLLPAAGPLPYYHLPENPAPVPGDRDPWIVPGIIEGIKAGQLLEIRMDHARIVSFPSVHAAAAILFTWLAWPNRILRIPILLANTAMLYSTILIGGHYLVDLIGGIVVAFACIVITGPICRTRSPSTSGGDDRPRAYRRRS